MLSLDEAYRRLLARAQLTDAESVPLADAVGRVLVEPKVLAAVDVPPFANSAMDGYAVRAADVPGALRVVGEIAAGARDAADRRAGNGGRDHDRRAAAARRRCGRADRGGRGGRWSRRDRRGAVRSGNHVRAAAHDTRAGDEICLPGALSRRYRRAGVAGHRRRAGPTPPGGRDPVDRQRAGRPRRAARPGPDPRRERRGPGGGRRSRPAASLSSCRASWTRRRPIESALMDAARRADLRRHLGRRQRRPARLCARAFSSAWEPRLLAHRGPAGQAARGGRAGRRDRHRPAGQSGQRARDLRALRAPVHPRHARPAGRRTAARARHADRAHREGRAAARVPASRRRGTRTATIHARPAGGQAPRSFVRWPMRNALLVVPEGVAAAEPALSYEAIVFEPMLPTAYR